MDNVLMHHGVKGQIWGVRRYQNEDGSRTDLGRDHENELKRYNRSLVYSSVIRSPRNRSANNQQSSNNSTYGVIKKEDPDVIPAEEEYESTPSRSSSSTVGVIRKGSSTTAKILKSSEVAKPLYKSLGSYKKIDTGKKIVALEFSRFIKSTA